MIRSYMAVLATFVVILMSLIATFGSVGLLGNPLNQMVTTIPILIISLALADCIHLFSIYFQNSSYSEGSAQNKVIKNLELDNITLKLDDNEIAKNLEKAIYHIERNGNSKIIFTDLSFIMSDLLHKKTNNRKNQ